MNQFDEFDEFLICRILKFIAFPNRKLFSQINSLWRRSYMMTLNLSDFTPFVLQLKWWESHKNSKSFSFRFDQSLEENWILAHHSDLISQVIFNKTSRQLFLVNYFIKMFIFLGQIDLFHDETVEVHCFCFDTTILIGQFYQDRGACHILDLDMESNYKKIEFVYPYEILNSCRFITGNSYFRIMYIYYLSHMNCFDLDRLSNLLLLSRFQISMLPFNFIDEKSEGMYQFQFRLLNTSLTFKKFSCHIPSISIINWELVKLTCDHSKSALLMHCVFKDKTLIKYFNFLVTSTMIGLIPVQTFYDPLLGALFDHRGNLVNDIYPADIVSDSNRYYFDYVPLLFPDLDLLPIK